MEASRVASRRAGDAAEYGRGVWRGQTLAGRVLRLAGDPRGGRVWSDDADFVRAAGAPGSQSNRGRGPPSTSAEPGNGRRQFWDDESDYPPQPFAGNNRQRTATHRVGTRHTHDRAIWANRRTVESQLSAAFD